MALDFTNTLASVYDTKRELIGRSDQVLTLIRLKPGNVGYTTITTIETGWFPKRKNSQSYGSMIFEIKIADVAGNLGNLLKENPVTHVEFDGLFYKVMAGGAPQAVTSKWVIRTRPTGEKKPQ